MYYTAFGSVSLNKRYNNIKKYLSVTLIIALTTPLFLRDSSGRSYAIKLLM